MALGAAVVYVLTYMPAGFVCFSAVALPLLSTLFAHHAKNVIRSDDFEGKIPPAPVTDSVVVPRPLLRILVGVLAYSLALGLMLGMMASYEEGGFDLANRLALLRTGETPTLRRRFRGGSAGRCRPWWTAR